MTLISLLQVTFFSISDGTPLAFEGDAITAFFKLLFVILAFLYVLFSFVVIRQIEVMRMTLITSFSPLVRLLGFLHLAAAVVVFLLILLFL
jgi:hypothetical protein